MKRRKAPWARIAAARRLLLLVLVIIPSIIASAYMADVLPHKGSTPLEVAIVVVFGALFAWISVGFWAAMFGFLVLARRYDRHAVTRALDGQDMDHFDPGGRTAIVVPVYNEDVDRVFAGIRATRDSLAAAGGVEHFDFFVLSDSTDPDHWVEEELAWAEFNRTMPAGSRIYYRRRRTRLKRKSGNVADFCRRWGSHYRYMIVFDADSVMSGDTLKRLVRIMELRPHIGIIQTAPTCVGQNSLFARVQQFANHLYGPMFAAGLHFWQLGDSQYWGHNAIIRVDPFIRYCALPRLAGKPPLGGDILSHDFVEAALMRRAGWDVWLAYDLPGSFEELPPNLLDELKRDRRWCQGNLQHLRLLFSRGLYPAHRALFVQGIMAYVSALLWLLFLALSTAEAVVEALREPVYFPKEHSLFPDWPVWQPQWALTLLALTGVVLFLPKLFSVLLVMFNGERARLFGGRVRLMLSVLLEVIFSTLFAPVRMLFHSKFVFITLLGQQVQWNSQNRGDSETGWREALAYHGSGTLLAIAWGVAVFLANPAYFWWLTPVIAALAISVPLSVYCSRPSLGRFARRLGLFLTPQESAPAPEFLALEAELARRQARRRLLPMAERAGFVRAVVDPAVNALHLRLARQPRRLAPAIRAYRQSLYQRALAGGPNALSAAEKNVLLSDPQQLRTLHQAVWSEPDAERAARWGRPGGLHAAREEAATIRHPYETAEAPQ